MAVRRAVQERACMSGERVMYGLGRSWERATNGCAT
jgi:hypothetical protein